MEDVLESVVEHHTDMLLVEELKCDREFAVWFAERCGVAPEPVTFVRNSVWDAERESDVVVQFGGASGSVVLVENKVTASLSLNQAADYHKRGQVFVGNGQSAKYRTCIMAPTAWLDVHPQHGFDVGVSYEELAEVIARIDDTRASWRANVFRQGARRAKRKLTYSNEQVAQFLRDYYGVARERYPELGTARSTGQKSLTVVYPLSLGSKLQLGRYVDVQHNIPEQRMKITITSCTKPVADDALSSLASDNGWLIVQNGNVLTLRPRSPLWTWRRS